MALTGYPAGPAAPAAPGAPLSPPKPGFPGMPSCPLVPGTPCKAKNPLRFPKHSSGRAQPRKAPWLMQLSHLGFQRCHLLQCRTLLSPHLAYHPSHTQGLGCSLPHSHPRHEDALEWAQWPPCGTSPQPSKGQLCTYRQPWEPSRTGVTCSALGKEGCSAVCPWNGGQGTGIRVRLCSEKSPSQHLSSVCVASGQNPASREWDQGPACSQKGVWDGSMLQEAQGMFCRSHIHAEGLEQQEYREQGEPYLRARSTTRTRGTWQGLGDRSTISDTALAEPPPNLTTRQAKVPHGKDFQFSPLPSQHKELSWRFPGGWSCKQCSPLDQLFLEILVDLELPFLPVGRQERFPFLCMF